MGTDNKWLQNYKDPRWQKKRLEIMERDDFACRSCGSKTDTLNVHHAYYDKGKKPWEYDNDILITWCEECHKENHAKIKSIQKELIRLNRSDMEYFEAAVCSFGAKSALAAFDRDLSNSIRPIHNITERMRKFLPELEEGMMVLFSVIDPKPLLNALRDANANSGYVDSEKIANFIKTLDSVYMGALEDNDNTEVEK